MTENLTSTPNISQISEVIQNVNYTIGEEINYNTILQESIRSTNDASNGFVGVMVLGIILFTLFVFFWKNGSAFRIYTKLGYLFAINLVFLDFALLFLIFGILENLYIFFFAFTVFFVVGYVSLIAKLREIKE